MGVMNLKSSTIRYNIISLLLLFSGLIYGQDSTFYAKNKQVSTLDSAEKVTIGETDKSNMLYLVRTFSYKNKEFILESENYFLNNTKDKLEGISRNFYKNGQTSSESYYKNGKLHGRDISYYPSGKIYHEKMYSEGKIDGNFKIYYANGLLKRDESYSKNELISGKMYDSTGVEIPFCGAFEQVPEYPGGTQKLFKYLIESIKFPKEVARNKEFKGGKVYLTFVLDTDGSVIDVEVVKGLHPACDAEAVRVISSMPKWRPGYQDCKPVKIKMNVPISFLLN